MSGNYSDVIEAVKNRLISAFEDLSEDNIGIDDIDPVVKFLSGSQDVTLGCTLDFQQGVELAQHSTGKTVWEWTFLGVLMLRVSDVDSAPGQVRTLIDGLYTAFPIKDRRLSGVAANSKITAIDRPRAVKIGETPYQFIPFIISVTTIPE